MEPSQPGPQRTAWAENIQYQPRTVRSSYGVPREFAEPQYRGYQPVPAPSVPYQIHARQQPPMFEPPMRQIRQYEDVPPTQPQPIYYVPVYEQPQPYTQTYPQNPPPMPPREINPPRFYPLDSPTIQNENYSTPRETRYDGDAAPGIVQVNQPASSVARQRVSPNESEVHSRVPSPPFTRDRDRRKYEKVAEEVKRRSESPLRLRTRTVEIESAREDRPEREDYLDREDFLEREDFVPRRSSNRDASVEIKTVRERRRYRRDEDEDDSSDPSDDDREYIRINKSAPGTDEGKVDITRSISIPYRERRTGRLRTSVHPYTPKEDIKNKKASSTYSDIPDITVMCYVDEQRTIRNHTIKIKSWMFIQFLSEMGKFKIYSNVDSGSITLREPFVDLFHRKKAMREFLAKADRDAATTDTMLRDKISSAEGVLDLLSSDFSALNDRFDQMTSSEPPEMVDYASLWMVYTPGTLVFKPKPDGGTSAYIIDSVQYQKDAYDVEDDLPPSEPILKLYCWSIGYHMGEAGYDGKFGRRGHVISIPLFQGSRPFKSLKYIPERFLGSDEIKNELIARGRIFWELSGPTYREVVKNEPAGRQKGERDRVMVDYGMYEDLRRDEEPDRDEGLPYPPDLSAKHSENLDAAMKYIAKSGRKGQVTSLEKDYSNTSFAELNLIEPSSEPSDLMLILCPPKILAFSLLQKYWSEYNVAHLKPVQFQHNAWSRIVLDQEYKDVVQAMVASYLRKSDTFQDLVPGKGAGISILLHGPPGVGKTLTAECVAESFQKPLYMVTAGDLGTDPESLEFKLSRIFDLAVRWDAILLLDEADVFLQDRDYENLTRNALVSIFLRTLEYFKGIMFLTSNRVGAFDQAFQSRIHITLGIPEFSESVRKQVWAIFIKDLGRKRIDGSPPLLTEEECKGLGQEVLKSWSRESLNGRQIRNCVRSALALAQNKQERLCAKHFNTVIRLGNTFTKYMTRLQKVEADELAQVKGDRLAEMGSLAIRSSHLEPEK
ncbi:uncharacterized protein GGS22DRAFT_198988 [Annulohypoxylon maeteangense]|uniref:uncharacterized protein n=1 Tax=Annulohypoxylon maeteangense TaxID=1927788 RepID=UPI00200850F3|nr:uncharacterized protein GGS22DRAFT_198988 [Annulohypoxylon maeteangense]KAI0886592.1 hypothetical protein GGS22DRAFT_198988 [Annulohypoxylon maeteangense]